MKVVVSANTVSARTTPHGFWRFSASYLIAAGTVEGKIRDEGQLLFPALQLYGVTIELGLKAFLLQRGWTLNQIRGLSHNLTRTLQAARRHKLGREVKLSPYHVAAIHLLDINYSSHRLRYIETGATKTPQLNYIASAARNIVIGLEYLCTGVRGRIERVAGRSTRSLERRKPTVAMKIG